MCFRAVPEEERGGHEGLILGQGKKAKSTIAVLLPRFWEGVCIQFYCPTGILPTAPLASPGSVALGVNVSPREGCFALQLWLFQACMHTTKLFREACYSELFPGLCAPRGFKRDNHSQQSNSSLSDDLLISGMNIFLAVSCYYRLSGNCNNLLCFYFGEEIMVPH